MARHRHIVAWLEEAADDLRNLCQDIHAHSEPGFEERHTAALVVECLCGWGYEVYEGIGRIDVVGVLCQGGGTQRLGLRADMNALPIVEVTGLGYSSCHGGRVHACGYDGHIAMLPGTVRYLAAMWRFGGTLVLIFQPVEKGQGGVEAMLANGLLECSLRDALFGMHNMPGLEAEHLDFRAGLVMAFQDLLSVTLEGVSGHGSTPHLSVDPLFVASSAVIVLQSVVARNVDPQKVAVVTAGVLQTGEAANVIPQRAMLRLSLWAFDGQVREQVLQRVCQIIELQAASYGCQASIEHYPAYPVLVNSVEKTEFVRQVGVELTDVEWVDGATPKLMGNGDFAWTLQRCPGSYPFIGSGRGRSMVHNPAYGSNDDTLVRGAVYWDALAETWLAVPMASGLRLTTANNGVA